MLSTKIAGHKIHQKMITHKSVLLAMRVENKTQVLLIHYLPQLRRLEGSMLNHRLWIWYGSQKYTTWHDFLDKGFSKKVTFNDCNQEKIPIQD